MSSAPVAPTYKSGKDSVAPTRTTATETARISAMEFLTKLATEVSKGQVDLPCFPNVVLRIRNALADPNNNAEKTVTIVGAEPRLAARLLQTANSAAFNNTGKPLTDLRTAITRLGQQLVQSAAMAFAMQHMKNEDSLKPIAKPMTELWAESIIVASICQVVARRTKINPDEAFLTGLLHGIGRLYIMVRAVGKGAEIGDSDSYTDLVAGWQASIGKAVLENWGFAEELAEAIGAQDDLNGERMGDRKRKRDADLADVLIASIALCEVLKTPPPREVKLDSIAAFGTIGLTVEHCSAIMTHAQNQLGSLQKALG